MRPRAAMVLAVILVATGCGDASPEPPPAGLGEARFTALTRELAAAGRQGRASATQAGAIADEQAQIARGYAARASTEKCKERLGRLSSAYARFARTAETFAQGRRNEEQYAQAAGAIATTLGSVESECT